MSMIMIDWIISLLGIWLVSSVYLRTRWLFETGIYSTMAMYVVWIAQPPLVVLLFGSQSLSPIVSIPILFVCIVAIGYVLWRTAEKSLLDVIVVIGMSITTVYQIFIPAMDGEWGVFHGGVFDILCGITFFVYLFLRMSMRFEEWWRS